MAKDQITAADMMPMGDYAKARKARRSEVARLKRQRRVEVGPFAVLAFECYETMRHHFHEMLLIEKAAGISSPTSSAPTTRSSRRGGSRWPR